MASRLLRLSSEKKKRTQTPKLLVPDVFRWVGGLPRVGVGAKKFGMFFESQGNQTFWRDIPGFLPGCSRGARRAREKKSRTKTQPKEQVSGTDTPCTSEGHSRRYPGPKLRSGRSKFRKNKHFGADIHDPKARTSTTLSDFQKLRSEKLWAEFSFPRNGVEDC